MKAKPLLGRAQLEHGRPVSAERECLLSIIVPVFNEERTIVELLGGFEGVLWRTR